MNITRHRADKVKILLDMKPAFDGYSGIPQESRLLFLGLGSMDGCEVEGLIQHGSRKLRSGLSAKKKALSTSERINRLSRVVVSLYQRPYSNIFVTASDAAIRYCSPFLLCFRALLGVPIRSNIFDPELFDDFIWRTLFSKTLNPADRRQVTSAGYRLVTTPRKLFHHIGLAGIHYSPGPKYLSLDTRGFDYFLAQTPFPARISPETQMIVRYHDAVPVLLPHTINDKAFHQASHFYSLRDNVQSGAWFSCVSEAARADLLKIFPKAESRSSVIHNIVSAEYFKDETPKRAVFQIIRNRLGRVKQFQVNVGGVEFDDTKNQNLDVTYLLMVSTLEPRKNHKLLLSAWEKMKYTSLPDLKLVVVGSTGWDSASILEAFKPWAERGDLFYLNNVPSSELRVLYKHASATICPSIAEGFNYSGIEAMQCNGIVVASDIPVHREVFDRGCEYFDPYSAEDAAVSISRILSKDCCEVRERLRMEARQVVSRYTPQSILPQWGKLFQILKKPQEI